MFRFSLQTALNVRSRQEKIKMKELAEKIAQQRNIDDQIFQVGENTKFAEQNLNSSKQSRFFTIDQMRFLTHFKSRMRVVLAGHYQQLETAKKEVEKKQHALIEASRKKRTLEILEEKEKKRYLEKITRMEKKNMDEIAGSLFLLKKRQE